MPRTTTVESLARTDLCRGLSAAEAQAIFALSEELELKAAQEVFGEGAAGDAVFVLVSGEAEVIKRDKAGQERLLAKLGPGAVLGEMSLINREARRSATARAVGAATLLRIPAAGFHALVDQGSLAGLKVVRNFAQVMSKRLALVDERVVELLAKAQGGKHEELGDFQKLLTNWSF